MITVLVCVLLTSTLTILLVGTRLIARDETDSRVPSIAPQLNNLGQISEFAPDSVVASSANTDDPGYPGTIAC